MRLPVKLQGQVIWLTGASSGIGEALAYALNYKGADLILSARNGERLEAVQAHCDLARGRVRTLPFDLSEIDALPSIAQQALQLFGRVDILLLNGGIGQFSPAVDTVLDVDRRVMQVNYLAQVALAKAVLPSMVARRSGRIVVVSSLAGKIGTPGRSAYSASKHALHGFFDSLRAELWRDGIKVTLICPGWVETNFRANALGADGAPRGKSAAAYSHAIRADECARQIVSAIEGDKEEVYLGRTRFAIYAQRLFPGLFSRAVRRFMRVWPAATKAP